MSIGSSSLQDNRDFNKTRRHAGSKSSFKIFTSTTCTHIGFDFLQVNLPEGVLKYLQRSILTDIYIYIYIVLNTVFNEKHDMNLYKCKISGKEELFTCYPIPELP